jgi:hypothetical protein
MFPGSLALGKWRIRGTEAGRFVLERFDDDGEVQTDGWLPVTAFTHDPDTNAAGLESAAVRVDTISPLSTAVGSEVTCDGNVTVTGRLACGGVNVGNGSVVVPSNLTVGGVSFASLQFTAVEPLRKVINLQTGAVELRVDTAELGGNPWFCAGVVNGATLSTVMSQGAVSFTVSRVPNYAAGVYKVTFASNHPRGSNYVVLVHSRNSNSYLTPVITEAPTPQTAAYFHVTLRNTTATALADEQFHFSVLA